MAFLFFFILMACLDKYIYYMKFGLLEMMGLITHSRVRKSAVEKKIQNYCKIIP